MIIIPQNPVCYLVPSVNSRKRRHLWSFLQTVYQDSHCQILLCGAFIQFKKNILKEIPATFKKDIIYYAFEKKFIAPQKKIDILVLDGPEFFSYTQILELIELKIPIIFLTCYSSDHFLTQDFFKKFEGFGFQHYSSPNLLHLALHAVIKKLSPPHLSFLFLRLAYVLSFGFRELKKKQSVIFIFKSHPFLKYGKKISC